MRLKRVLLLLCVAILGGGVALPEGALARGGGGGGGGGGRGGGGRGGGGRGKGKRGGGEGQPMDRAQLLEKAEADMHLSDREVRFQTGRKATFDEVQKTKREEVLSRHRRMGEDSRRQQDSRIEVVR
jgi:hypothetical protein